MERFSNERGLICKAEGWIGDGSWDTPHDEQHACLYEVSERGTEIGSIKAYPYRHHPDVKWQRSVLRDEIEELDGKKYATMQEALAAF